MKALNKTMAMHLIIKFSDGIKLHFDIRDFIQVNRALNERMVNTALDWLELNQ